ncbi:TetR/AcrR family transcriptional regulator [Baekduia soli]|uniref:TetR/AcrR family transcriptional regulator n=1 Tax=Baekduia soli TaxID=496014 RepID=A0A5B8UC80_9ACTN|nr:TetR/AcrR family transcriptional regulator [Baekduia soli]
MGRDSTTLSSREQVLVAALESFVQRGYHGTTIRQVAARAGVSVPGLYHHFPSKLALVETLLEGTMDDLIAGTEAALAEAGPDPVDRFSAVVVAHVRFHTDRPEESFVGNTELRSLSPASLRRVVAKRDRQEEIFTAVVAEGVAAGAFHVDAVREASRAVVTMCTAVANWYHRDGALDADQIVEIYRRLALNLVGVAPR